MSDPIQLCGHADELQDVSGFCRVCGQGDEPTVAQLERVVIDQAMRWRGNGGWSRGSLERSCDALRRARERRTIPDPDDVRERAYCAECDADTPRCGDGTCSPCESREPWLDGDA